MQFSFRHAALIASVLLGVLATVSLTLYLNGGDKGKPPGDAQSQPHEEGLENFVQFSRRVLCPTYLLTFCCRPERWKKPALRASGAKWWW